MISILLISLLNGFMAAYLNTSLISLPEYAYTDKILSTYLQLSSERMYVQFSINFVNHELNIANHSGITVRSSWGSCHAKDSLILFKNDVFLAPCQSTDLKHLPVVLVVESQTCQFKSNTLSTVPNFDLSDDLVVGKIKVISCTLTLVEIRLLFIARNEIPFVASLKVHSWELQILNSRWISFIPFFSHRFCRPF